MRAREVGGVPTSGRAGACTEWRGDGRWKEGPTACTFGPATENVAPPMRKGGDGRWKEGPNACTFGLATENVAPPMRKGGDGRGWGRRDRRAGRGPRARGAALLRAGVVEGAAWWDLMRPICQTT